MMGGSRASNSQGPPKSCYAAPYSRDQFGASGATCWRRLKEWHDAGAWQRLHEALLAELRAAGRLELAHAVVDSAHLRALKGGPSPA